MFLFELMRPFRHLRSRLLLLQLKNMMGALQCYQILSPYLAWKCQNENFIICQTKFCKSIWSWKICENSEGFKNVNNFKFMTCRFLTSNLFWRKNLNVTKKPNSGNSDFCRLLKNFLCWRVSECFYNESLCDIFKDGQEVWQFYVKWRLDNFLTTRIRGRAEWFVNKFRLDLRNLARKKAAVVFQGHFI